jgi:hypothetical protein
LGGCCSRGIGGLRELILGKAELGCDSVVALQWISGFRVAFRKCSGRSFECDHIRMLFIALDLQDPSTETIHRACVTLRVSPCQVFKSIFSFDVTGTWLFQIPPSAQNSRIFSKFSQTPSNNVNLDEVILDLL